MSTIDLALNLLYLVCNTIGNGRWNYHGDLPLSFLCFLFSFFPRSSPFFVYLFFFVCFCFVLCCFFWGGGGVGLRGGGGERGFYTVIYTMSSIWCMFLEVV